MKENHLNEMEARNALIEEIRKQNVISQEQVDNKMHQIQQQMRLELARMVEQMMQTHLHPSQIPNTHITTTNQSSAKRTNDDITNHERMKRNEKRHDTRDTPTKKQLTYPDTDEDDLEHTQAETSTMDEDDNASISE
jgi:hypothetical protein